MPNHFMSLPKEIIEAAEMDAAGPLRMLWRVVLPMSWPTLVAFTLITIVNEWNQYLWPLLIAEDESVAPLPIGLTQLQDNEGLTNWGPVMAGTVLTMLPILIIFLLLQRAMIKGLTAGAIKGRCDLLVVNVVRVERLGSETFGFADPVGLTGGATLRDEHLVLRLDKRQQIIEGSELTVRVHRDEELLFDSGGGLIRAV